MTDPVRLYTPAEAGAVSGLELKAVHNAIDKRIVEPVGRAATARPARRPRYLTGEDLVRLRLWRGVGETLSAERRQRLFQEIDAKPGARTVKADDLLIVDVSEARRQVGRGVRDLDAAEALVRRDKAVMGGEPVFKGTRIPVYGVCAMLDAGAMPAELLAGYPMLDRRMLDLGKLWAASHPRRGRPKLLGPLGLTLKSSTRAPMKSDPLGRTKAVSPSGG